MVRKLVRTLVSLLLATPLSVWGLGLGDIHLYSALNEKLNAKIDLLSVEEGDLASIEVELASYDAFERIGIERVGTLALLDFVVEKGPSGKPHVRVTSKEAIREPFLDFLVDVEWRYGKLLREYTLLLDPPEIAKGRTPNTVAPAAAPARTSRTATEPSTSVQRTSGEPRTSPAGRGDGSIVHGPVQANETLWSIARRLRKNGDASIHQMMIALFRANPDAFLDDNINKLRKGAILRLDDAAMARELNQADAIREVARQSRSWERMKASRNEQSAAGGSPEPAPVSSVATREKAKLKLLAPEGKASEAGGTSESGEDDIREVRNELMLALEAAETQRQENGELRERLQELEGQLASMQRLVSLKSNEMGQIQGQLVEDNSEKGLSEKGSADQQSAPVDAENETPVADNAADNPVQSVQANSETAKSQPTPKPKPKLKPVSEPEPEPEPVQVGLMDELLSNPSGFMDKLLSNPYGVMDKLLSNPYTIGGLGLGIVLLGLLAIVIRRRMNGGSFQESILTGGTSSMLNPKGGEGDSSMETSLLSDLADDGMGGMPVEDSEVDPITEADVYMAYGRHQQAEELLKDAIEQEPERHELLVKLMEIYDKTRNKRAFLAQAGAAHAALGGTGPLWDKIAAMGHELAPEHDLFAEAPKNPAVADEPSEEPVTGVDDVLDIGLDLDALAAEMEHSHEHGSGDQKAGASAGDTDWDLDLGVDLSELDDELPKQWVDTDRSESEAAVSADADDLGFEMDGETEGESAEPNTPENDDFSDLDFGFDTEEDSPRQGFEETAAPARDNGFEELDFGLDDTESANPGAAKPASEGAGAETGSEDNGLEFSLDDFDLPEEQSETSAQPEEIEHEEGAVMDFDLGDFKLSDDDGDTAEPEFTTNEIPSVGASETSGDEAVLDFGFGMDEEPSALANGSATESGPEEGSGDFDLDLDEEFGGGLDEIGTKLDLATAYVEMGDASGAREMLDEVLQEGDTEQKQRAQQLLDQMAS